MKMPSHAPALCTLTLLAAASALATPTTLVYSGTLRDDHGPVSGTVSAVFTVFDDADAGSAVFSQTEAALEVIDGALVVELGHGGDLDDDAIDGAPLYLEVAINGTTLTPRARIDEQPAAHLARVATSAPVAYDTDAVGAFPAAEAVSLAALAMPGRGAVHAGNVTELPAAFADGDQGIEFTPSSQFALTEGVLSLAPGAITTAEIADGALASVKLASGTVGAAQLATGAVGTTKIPNGAVQGSHVANGTLSAGRVGEPGYGNAVPVYRVVNTNCLDGAGTLTIRTTCTTSVGGCGVGNVVSCGGGCVPVFGGDLPACANTLVGYAVFGPN